MEFLQNDQNLNRLYWVVVLVEATDGVTGLTGQSAHAEVSINGAAAQSSVNALVEVDSANMPGHYYLPLATSEVQTLGPISIYVKTASSLAFHDRGYVTYQDPYASVGVLATGGSGSTGLKRDQVAALVKEIRKVVRDELAAQEKVEVPEDDDSEQIAKLDQILAAVTAPEEEREEIDLSPVLDAIASLPEPIDHTAAISAVGDQVRAIPVPKDIDVGAITAAIASLQVKLAAIDPDVTSFSSDLVSLKSGLSDLESGMASLSAAFDDATSLDLRFSKIIDAARDGKLDKISGQISTLATGIAEVSTNIKKTIINSQKR
jgi:hypothetical protein